MPHLRVALVGLLLLVLAGGAAYFFLRSARRPSNPANLQTLKPSQIVTVTPAAAPTNAAPAVVEEKEDRNSLEWLKKHDKRYFIPPDAVRRPNGRLYTKAGRRILEALPARSLNANEGKKIIFRNKAERDIAKLLKIEPGRPFLGGNYYRFAEDLQKAIESPTLVYKEDDAETVALKRQVNEVKAELKARMDAGEDITQIMKDTETELRSLAAYRKDLMKELTEKRFDENVSESDYKDYVAAASKMLEARGMRGLTVPQFAEGQLKYQREVHNAKAAAKAAREAARVSQSSTQKETEK